MSTFHFAAPEEVFGHAAGPNPSAVSVLPGHKGILSSPALNLVCISPVCLSSSALQTCPLLSVRRSLLPGIKEEEWDWSLQHPFSKKIFSCPAIVNVLKSSRCDFYICTNLWHYSSSMYLACQLIVSASCCAHSFEGFKMLLQKYSSLSSECFPQRKPSKLFPSQAYFLIQIIAVHWTLSCWGQSWILRSFDSLRRSMWASLYKLAMQWANSKDTASPLAHSLPHCSFLWEYLICI